MPAEKNVVSGALLGFKVGTQAKVDQMLGDSTTYPAQHGCFYLTKDSHRLYIGNEDGSLSALNEGIETVANMAALTAIADTAAASGGIGLKALAGRFYYDTADNILCVYNGTNWVQLNENTNTTIDSHTYSVSTSNGVATITNDVIETGNAHHDATLTVTGSNGITVSGTGTAITIGGDTYTLSTAAGSTTGTIDVKLDSTNTNNDSKFTLKPGSGVSLSRDATDGSVTINAPHNDVDSVDVSAQSAGFKFKVTSTSGAAPEDTIDPKIAVYTSSSPSGTTTNSVSFVNGTATLDVYSRSAIDDKLYAVNAMTYRGTLGNGSNDVIAEIDYDSTTGAATVKKNSTAVPVSIGDTFLASTTGTYNGRTYKEGSLFIVRALPGQSENAQGIIAPGDYTLDLVREHYATDSQYCLQSITNGIQLHQTNGGSANQGGLVVTAGSNNSWIDVSESSVADNDGVLKTLTVTHKAVTRTNTTGTAVTQNVSNTNAVKSTITIPAITAITTDTAGHITGVETTSYTVKDSNAEVNSVTTSSSAYSTSSYKVGAITTTVELKQSDNATSSQSGSFVLSSSSLDITDEDTRAATSGGSATQGLKIDMVWGSF